MKMNLLYKLLIAVLVGSVLVIIYGIVAYIFDIEFFRNSLPYATIVFQVVVLLVMLHKITVNIKLKKPIGNLLGVTALVATTFIGATYLYMAIMEVLTK